MTARRTVSKIGDVEYTGVTCSSCGTTYSTCTRNLLSPARMAGKPCCSRCGYTDTHAVEEFDPLTVGQGVAKDYWDKVPVGSRVRLETTTTTGKEYAVEGEVRTKTKSGDYWDLCGAGVVSMSRVTAVSYLAAPPHPDQPLITAVEKVISSPTLTLPERAKQAIRVVREHDAGGAS